MKDGLRTLFGGQCELCGAWYDYDKKEFVSKKMQQTAHWFERWLRRTFEHKEIGWNEIGEEFTRYFLFKSRFGNIYLHQLNAPNWHPECHDHPWSFLAILLWNGYTERVIDPCNEIYCPDKDCRYHRTLRDVRRRPGSILWRPASFVHNVITPFGTSWSLIFTGPKSREWGFIPCNPNSTGTAAPLPYDKYRELYKGKGGF